MLYGATSERVGDLSAPYAAAAVHWQSSLQLDQPAKVEARLDLFLAAARTENDAGSQLAYRRRSS